MLAAAESRDLETFLSIAFPPAWSGIAARIIETGAEMAPETCGWAPRWSRIPPTVRRGNQDLDTATKSVIFRVHDCLHQLWGLPHPGSFSTDDFYAYKRAQMCGEVAVLTLTEFAYCDYLRRTFPEVESLIWKRNAIPLLDGPLAGKSLAQVAMRLDELLHKKTRPKWVRDNPIALAFVDDYVPMLERDRQQIDQNWAVMKAANWLPEGAPKAKFGPDLDGLELTVWMIHDFEQLLSSSRDIDYALAAFNRQRRARLELPAGWVS
jgi:hypothetical protein